MLHARSARRAVVLLVSVAILSVLAILATVFATMTRIERSVARNYVDLVRARMLAQAGIELGARVFRDPSVSPQSRTYFGEDHNGDGTLANAWGVMEDVYRPGGQANTLQTLACPLSYALRPSLFYDANLDGRPDVLTVRDPQAPGGQRQAGYSGILAGTYQQFGDTFAVKLVDQNDLIDLNDVMVNAAGAVMEPNTRLARVLNTLGQVLGLSGNEGTLITNWRALYAPVAKTETGAFKECTGVTGGFTSIEQLAQILPPNSYNLLKDYVSTYAWKDLSTIQPQPQTFGSIMPLVTYSQGSQPADKYNFQHVFEPRAPINMNTAPVEVLCAEIAGISANYVAVVPGNFNGGTETELYQVRTSNIPTYTGTGSTPYQIARTMVWYRTGANGPFETWEEWGDFVDNNLVGSTNPYNAALINSTQGKVLKAAFNPNARWMRANPDRCMRQRSPGAGTGAEVDIDKTDLSVYSTEFCFSPKGTFVLASYGRVLDGSSNVVAHYEIRTVARAFDTVRLTSARDFRRNSVSFATQYVATLPGSPPDHSSSTTEDHELNSGFDVPMDDARWAYDGAITERTGDPAGLLNPYLQPSTTPSQGGGTYWMSNPTINPIANGPSRPREDRMIGGSPSNYYGGVNPDSIKGDVFSDGVYLGSDRYRALTYALPWGVNTPDQAGSNLVGISLDYWMKPNCQGSRNSSMRRGYQFIRTDEGVQTVQMRIWQMAGGNRVTWDGRRYGQFTARWWDQISADNHDGILEQWGSDNFDPNTFSGFSIVTSASNEKFGVQWDWRSTNGPRRLFAGMWHHFYLETWDEGYYTASAMWVDGVREPGFLARYGDPNSGWVTVPLIIQVTPRLYYIYYWLQPMVDLRSIVDVATSMHDVAWGDEPRYDVDRMFAGTMDAFRLRQGKAVPPVTPIRFNPGVNAQYGGRVPRTWNATTLAPNLPTKEMPSNQDITIMGVEWTRYRPTTDYNGQTIPTGNRPTTQFSYGVVNSGFAYTLTDTTGKPQALNYLIGPSQTFQYRIRFTNNLAPVNLRESAYFDDVTIHYHPSSQAVRYLSWSVSTSD